MKKLYLNKFSFLLLLVMFYFTFHLFNGQNSLSTLEKNQAKLALLEAELAEISAKNLKLSNKLELLKSPNTGQDLLDEKKREMLGLASESEAVIFYNLEDYR